MVLDVSQSVPHPNTDEESDQYDVVSVAASDGSFDKSLALRGDQTEPPVFGNISVANSSDVHFGNKTFYQGSVTIKQFLYGGGKIEQCNNSAATITSGKIVHSGEVNPTFVIDADSNGFITSDGISLPTQKPNQTSEKKLSILKHKHLIVITVIVGILMVSLVVLLSILLTKKTERPPRWFPSDSDEQEIGTPIKGPFDPEVNITSSGKLKIISRLEWVAQPPEQPANLLTLPVPYVIIMHTATENCSDQATCTFHVRYIQTFHMESRHWWDIGYNFLIGGDGFVYEGRGWKSEGAHTYGYNARSIGIAFIGTFNKIVPPPEQMLAAKKLIEKGVEMGYLSPSYKLLAARQLQATQSPGTAFYEELKKWTHWSAKP